MPSSNPLPPNVTAMRGTENTARPRFIVGNELAGEPVRPTWVTGRARKLFEQKVETYTRRRLSVVGLEASLGHYCALEAEIIEKRKARQPVSASDMNALLKFFVQFYDTPASRVQSGHDPKPAGNPFADHDKPGA